MIVVLTDTSLEKKIEEAMRRAERLEATSEMAASIAHEIRNPLASIRGSVQEMGRGLELPPELTATPRRVASYETRAAAAGPAESAEPAELAWYRLDVFSDDGQYLAITNPIFVGPKRPPEHYLYGDFL